MSQDLKEVSKRDIQALRGGAGRQKARSTKALLQENRTGQPARSSVERGGQGWERRSGGREGQIRRGLVRVSAFTLSEMGGRWEVLSRGVTKSDRF